MADRQTIATTARFPLGGPNRRRLAPPISPPPRIPGRGIELDPLYVDVIIRRYEAATGVAVILADTGETFEKLTVRRLNDGSDERTSFLRGKPARSSRRGDRIEILFGAEYGSACGIFRTLMA